MKKIIVPTDFSPTAANTFAYAKKLAAFTNSPLKVVHFFHPSAENNRVLPVTLEEIEKKATEKLTLFTKFREEGSSNVETLLEKEVKAGFAAEEIIKLSKEKDTDFILMGTTGDGGILENLVGSVSSSVAQKAHCPVWLIPPNVRFSGINKIMFAGNYDTLSNAMIDEIIELSDLFGADIHLVHVNEAGDSDRDSRLEETVLDRFFEKRTPDFMLKIVTIEGDTVWKSLQDYSEENSIDLTVMVTKQRSFWQNILHISTTKAMILHARKPLLILHLEDAN